MNMVHIVKTCFLRKVETLSSSGADSSLFLVNSHCCLFGPHLWLGIQSILYWSHLHVFFSPSLDCKLFEGNNLIFFFFLPSLRNSRFSINVCWMTVYFHHSGCKVWGEWIFYEGKVDFDVGFWRCWETSFILRVISSFTMIDMYNTLLFITHIIIFKCCLSLFLPNWKITMILIIKE